MLRERICIYETVLTGAEVCAKARLVYRSSSTCSTSIFLYAIFHISHYTTRPTLPNPAPKVLITSLPLVLQLRSTARLYVKCRANFHASSSQQSLWSIRMLKVEAHASTMACRRSPSMVSHLHSGCLGIQRYF